MKGLISILFVFGFSQVASANGGKTADVLLQEAKVHYAQREDMAKTDQTISVLLEAASVSADKTDLKYEIWILASRAAYWKGQHQTVKDEKMKVMSEAMKFALEARKQNAEYAESYYYYGTALARWAEAKGALEALAKKKDIVQSMDETLSRETMMATPGEELEGFGPDRTFGRMYYRLPASMGGNKDLSVKHLSFAKQNAPSFALNHIYLSEVLATGTAAEKANACQILKDFLKQDPMTFNPDRIPETKFEMAEGRKLESMICH